LQQALRDVGCPVAEGDKADVKSSQGGYAVVNVAVHGELVEAVHDVLDRLVDGAVEGQAAQDGTQYPGSELGKWCGAAGGGEGEAVPEEGCEPGRGQMGRSADVDEPFGHR